MGEADVDYVRETMELFLSNDRDAAWARWAQDCVAVSPPEWPEAGATEGRVEVRAIFDGFDDAFGADWPTSMRLERVEDAGGGRVLVELGWTTSGVSSGATVEQPMSGIFTSRAARSSEPNTSSATRGAARRRG
ncbi:MAG: hypothetical protein ACRDKV_01385 [Solirubrobacterales bacterium]